MSYMPKPDMPQSTLFFLYCPKLIVFSEDWQQVLLVRRSNEADYDGTWSFVGGKLETTDESIKAGIRREKNEEIGENARVEICLSDCNTILWRKGDGNSMLLPHYVARYKGGEIELNTSEYSEFQWFTFDEIATLEPKIANIPEHIDWADKIRATLAATDFEEL